MFRGRLTARSTGWRLGVATIVFACLLGQVTALAHRVLVRHVTCAEHGESVHLGLSEGSSEGGLSDRGATDVVALVGNAPLTAADEHDHCSVLVSRGVSPRLQSDQAIGPCPLLFAGDLPGDAILGAVIAPYLVAPKTSPPRSAS